MKLDTFITLYKTKLKTGDAQDFVKEHIKNSYVPFETKADMAKAIVDSCYYKTEKNRGEKERKVFHIDSVARYMLTCMAMVDLYTDLERKKQDGKMLEDFNKLNQLGIIDMIVSGISEKELKEFNMVVEMTCNDAVENEYEPHAFIASQVERFGSLTAAVLEPVLAGLDLDKIKDVMTSTGISLN